MRLKEKNIARISNISTEARMSLDGALIVPTDDNDGQRILHLSQIDRIETGENHIFEQYGFTHKDANTLVTLKNNDKTGDKSSESEKKEPLFFRTNIDSFYRAYHAAMNGRLVNICKFTSTSYQDSVTNLHKPLTHIENKGLYIGAWLPIITEGDKPTPLRQNFDLYAMRHDLLDDTGQRLFVSRNNANTYIATMDETDGHRGTTKLLADEDIYEALETQNTNALGEWFLPPIELLAEDSKYTQYKSARPFLEKFYKHLDLVTKDDFKNHHYLSSSFADASKNKPLVFSLRHEREPTISNKETKHPIRLIRLEPRL